MRAVSSTSHCPVNPTVGVTNASAVSSAAAAFSASPAVAKPRWPCTPAEAAAFFCASKSLITMKHCSTPMFSAEVPSSRSPLLMHPNISRRARPDNK